MVGDPSAITVTARSQEKPMLLILQTGSAAGAQATLTRHGNGQRARGCRMSGSSSLETAQVASEAWGPREETHSHIPPLDALGLWLWTLLEGPRRYAYGPKQSG
jgi:hypothetical protein